MTWLGRYEELAWAVGLCLVTGWMLHWSVQRLRLALECRAWPQAEGVIMHSDVTYGGSSAARLNPPQFLGASIVYRYRVRGRLYTGSDVRFTTFYVRGSFRSLQRYRAGQKVRVWHHPDDPNTAVLEPGATVDGWVEAVAYGVFFLLCASWTVHEAATLAGWIAG